MVVLVVTVVSSLEMRVATNRFVITHLVRKKEMWPADRWDIPELLLSERTHSKFTYMYTHAHTLSNLFLWKRNGIGQAHLHTNTHTYTHTHTHTMLK